MSIEENKAAVRRFTERFSRGDLSAVDEFVTDDVRYHNAPPGLAAGKEGYRQLMGEMFVGANEDFTPSLPVLPVYPRPRSRRVSSNTSR